jgi:hypothetical protein
MPRVRVLNTARCLLAILGFAALGSCGEPLTTEPDAPGGRGSLGGASNPKLVECPTSQSLTASATALATDETTIAIGATTVVVPVGAVLEPTLIELTIPASRYVEIRLRANGAEHYEFALPIAVTIDYQRCTRNDVLSTPVDAAYIDVETKAILYKMGGVDSKLTRSVFFTTDHFSGYAIAF